MKIGDTIPIRAVCNDEERIYALDITADRVESFPNVITINGDVVIRDKFSIENDTLVRVNEEGEKCRAEIVLHAKHRHQDYIQLTG